MYWTGKSMNNLLPYCGLVDKCFWQRFTFITEVKQGIDAPASATLSAPIAEHDVEVEIHGPSNPIETKKQATVEVEVENGTTNQPEKIANGETTLMAKPNASDEEVNANATVITNVKQGINAPASAPLSEPDAENDVGVQIHGPSKATETWKHATVEAMVEKVGKITYGETTLKANAPDAKIDKKF